ncbi:putative RNA-binding protein [Cladobotryum mycophilum]|uniref:RNA-binding protein n=1 Tax=Cladobotryum mycophilum TaxID=491253 RepID=A0ABR0SB01_9HYPO
MAPVLRKRKSVEAVKPNGASPKAAVKATPKPKRKAAEDSSPVSLKKQKATKKTAVEKKTPKEEPKKSKKAEETIEVEPEVASEPEEQDDEKLQVLAVDLDPEEEEETKEETFQPGQDVGKIPKVSKEVQKAAQASTDGSGVVYIGRIPHGFYEHEMKQYLSQFGTILKLRLARNKKTGASKHFAFVEFTEASTAEIVAKTMDNYLLFGHILKCKTVAKEQLHDDLWKGANRRFKRVPWNKMAGKQLEKPLTESAWANKLAKERSSRTKKAAKLKEIGYEFEAPELKEVPAPVAIENGDKEDTAIEAAPEPEKEEKAVEEAEKPAEVEEPEAEVEVEAPKRATRSSKVSKAKATKSAKTKKAKA